MEPRDLKREMAALRRSLGRYQIYLGAVIAVIGLSVVAAVAVVSWYGIELRGQVDEVGKEVAALSEDMRTRNRAMALDLARQQRELDALRHAAQSDLRVIQEAHRKLATIRDPEHELTALREANEALWSALAEQRMDLLTALSQREPRDEAVEDSPPTIRRFELGQTEFLEGEPGGGVDGFVAGEQEVRRGSQAPGQPGHLLIELDPERIRLGDDYRLEVRLINRSNRPLEVMSLRLDWKFGLEKTGGPVALALDRVDPRTNGVLFRVSGQWTPAHESSPVVLKATLTLKGGAMLANTLSW